MKANDKDDMKTLDALEKSKEEPSDLITLSSGVVLRGKKANPLALMTAVTAHPRPDPPIWFDEKMGREMLNYDDPNYLEEIKGQEMKQSNAMLVVMISYGTELVSVPKGMEEPHPIEKKVKVGVDEKKKPIYETEIKWPKWIEDYSLMGIPMHPTNKSWRYLRWVQFEAMSDEEDMEKIQEVVGRLSGLTEKSVQDAEDFPGSDKTLYEEHSARLERGIGLEAWGEMGEMEKALIVASRRTRIAIHNLQEEAQIEQSKRDAKRR